MTIDRPIIVRLNAVWPKHQMICGVVYRLRSASETPECLMEKKWLPCEAVG